MWTFSPRDSRMAARLAAAIPLPSEDTTPPVTKTYRVCVASDIGGTAQQVCGILHGPRGARCWFFTLSYDDDRSAWLRTVLGVVAYPASCLTATRREVLRAD